MTGDHHLRRPLAGSDAEHLELDRQRRRVAHRLVHVGVDPAHVGLDDRLAARVVVLQLRVEVAAIHVETGAEVALQLARAEDLGHRAGGAAPPHLELEQAILGGEVALRQEEVDLVLGVDVVQAPAIADDLHRLRQARHREAGGRGALRADATRHRAGGQHRERHHPDQPRHSAHNPSAAGEPPEIRRNSAQYTATKSEDALRPRIRLQRPQRQLRRRQGAPAGALDVDPLRAPGDADRAAHHLARRRPHAAARARRHLDRRRQGGGVRPRLRGPVLLPGAADRPGRRRAGGRPAAHRPQPERHRHDDVPDPPARVHQRHGRGHDHAAAGAARAGGAAHPHDLRRAHPHPAGAGLDHCPLPARGDRAARARRQAAGVVVPLHQPEPARGVRHHRHRLSDRSPPHQRAARLRRSDRQHLRQHRHGGLPARERLGDGHLA